MADASKPKVARWLWWAGLLAFGGAAVVLTALAYHDIVPGVVRAHDKAVHFLMAGALVFFLDGVLERRGLVVARVGIPIALLVVLVPAGIDEYLQRFTTFRTSELGDWAADAAGATVFLLLSRRLGAGAS